MGAPAGSGRAGALVPGERVGLIGESGSGKSLTAASIMGLLPDELHATGTIRLAGFDGDVLTASEKRLARMRADLVSVV
ncbi:ATP-binding cassette domain-containing protein, partial [Mycobacterium tuberculosis]|nr:ATP-binding cassette domain-containing protein [Mycobacterium tuberculosis]